MTLRKKSIEFDLVFISGQVHIPEFKYQVKSDNMISKLKCIKICCISHIDNAILFMI